MVLMRKRGLAETIVGPTLSIITNDSGHQAVIFEIGVSSGGKPRFGLIMIGTIEAFPPLL